MIHAETYSGWTLLLSPSDAWFKGASKHPWRSHKVEFTPEDIFTSPSLLERSHVLAEREGEPAWWLASRVRNVWTSEGETE